MPVDVWPKVAGDVLDTPAAATCVATFAAGAIPTPTAASTTISASGVPSSPAQTARLGVIVGLFISGLLVVNTGLVTQHRLGCRTQRRGKRNSIATDQSPPPGALARARTYTPWQLLSSLVRVI